MQRKLTELHCGNGQPRCTYSALITRSAVARHNREVARTLALSTLMSFFLRFMAMSAAVRIMRSTSGTVYLRARSGNCV